MKNDNKRQLSEDEIAESTESPKNKTMRTYIYSSDIDIEEHHPIKVRYSEKNTKIWKKNLSLCVDVSYVLNFYPPQFCFRILIQFLESKFSFFADILFFYVMIYNSKTSIMFLITDLDSNLKLKF